MAYSPPENDTVDFGLEDTSTPTNDSVSFNVAEDLTVLSVTPISATSTPSTTDTTTNTETTAVSTATADTETTIIPQTTVTSGSGGTSSLVSDTTILPISTNSYTETTTTPSTAIKAERTDITAQQSELTETTVETSPLSPSFGDVESVTTLDSDEYLDPDSNGLFGPLSSVQTTPSTFEITEITPNFKYISNPRVNLLVEYEPRDIDVQYTRDTAVEYE